MSEGSFVTVRCSRYVSDSTLSWLVSCSLLLGCGGASAHLRPTPKVIVEGASPRNIRELARRCGPPVSPAPSPASRETAAPEPCPPSDAGRTVATIQTAGGLLEIIDDDVTRVLLDETEILHGAVDGKDEPPYRSLFRYFHGLAPFEDVVILRKWNGGNACDGWGFTFIGINADGSYRLSDLPYCGGPEPIVTSSATEVRISIPAHPPNRGTGVLPAQVWVYSKGTLRRTR